MESITFKHIGGAIIVLKSLLIVYILWSTVPSMDWSEATISSTFLGFLFVGFVAQIIDGALGMAYGVSCSTLLMNLGVSPKLASTAVHTAEVFTTGVSGLSHLRFKNIDKKLFFKIVFPGVVGAMLGAYLISDVLDGKVIKPYISTYLLILGVVILYKGIRNISRPDNTVRYAEVLAIFGGFMDAVGGGGWGPIVTSNIINQGKDPRETIGTVNTAEFFVSFFSTGVFMFFGGVQSWQIVLGLIVGGVIAAPIGAYLTKVIEKRTLMIAVGVLIIATSSYTLYKIFFQA